MKSFMSTRLIKRAVTAITVGALFALGSSLPAEAGGGATCGGKFVMPSMIDWAGFFPITIGSIPIVHGDRPDTPNPSSPVCTCPAPPPIFERIGLSFGYWEPVDLVDITKTPFCMVNMGMKLNIHMKETDIGGRTSNHDSNYVDSNFFHAHWYRYPIVYLLNLLTDVACMQTGGINLAYMSEFDPTWQDDQLALIVNPEAALFGNMVSRLACIPDALATLTNASTAIDPLFWCMGDNGPTYPLDGNNIDGDTPIQSATLLQERFNFKMHREGVITDTLPVQGAMCYSIYMPIMPKSRYRYEMVNTIPNYDVHPYGHDTMIWGAGHNNPTSGNDFGFLVWRKRNCCLL